MRDTPNEPAKPRRRPPRRRRWLRRLGFCALAFAALLPLANGPLFRLVVQKVLTAKLGDAGLAGEFQISGSALSGIALEGVDLSGDGAVAELTAGEASVGYRLFGLLGDDKLGAIGPIRIRGVDALFVGQDKPDPEPRSNALETLRAIGASWQTIADALRIEVAIDDVNIEVVDKERAPQVRIHGIAAHLRDGQGEFGVEDIEVEGIAPLRDLRAQIALRDDSTVELGGLAIEDGLAVSKIEIGPPAEGSEFPTARGEVMVFGGDLSLVPIHEEALEVQLDGGAVDLGRLAARFGKPGAIGGTIEKLQARIEGSSVDSARLSGAVAGRSLVVERLPEIDADTRFGFETGTLTLSETVIKSGTSRVAGSGQIELPPAPDALPAMHFELEIDAPELGSLLAPFDIPVGGDIGGDVAFSLRDGKVGGIAGDLRANELRYHDVRLDDVELRATPDGSASKLALSAKLGTNTITAGGRFDFETLRYQANANADLVAIEEFSPLLSQLGVSTAVAGAVALEWRGEGAVADTIHEGSAELDGLRLQIGEAEEISGRLSVAYAPERFSATGIALAARGLAASGDIHLGDGRLQLKGVDLRREEAGGTRLAQLDASLPFRPDAIKDLDSFFAQEGSIELNLVSEELPIAELAELAGATPLGGKVDATVRVGGSLAEPEGTGKIAISQFGTGQPDGAKSLDADLDFELGGGRVQLDGELRAEGLPAVTLAGGAPLRPRAIADAPDTFASQRFDLSARFPKTELEDLMAFFPMISEADGNVSAQLDLSGTLDAPELSGQVLAEARRIRFERPGMPSITDVAVDIGLSGDRVDIATCRVTVAGGEIALRGGAQLAPLDDPEFELRLDAGEALVYRDENMSLRTNAALALDGPLSAAVLSGQLGVIHGHFLQEIEILPIGLPNLKRTPSVPKAPALNTRKHVGIDIAPFSDWRLDLRVVTEEPFLVRSNLARADVAADLTVTGTGARPLPKGRVWLLEGARATLPFSELEVREGLLEFDEGTGFDPQVRFYGVSELRSNRVILRVYDQISNPRTLITSDPPMPEEDAVALLATGRKASELGDSEVLAGAAATLLFDKVKRRFFKTADQDDRPFSDRVEIKAGGIDPKTGHRSAKAEVQLSDRVILLGGVDTEGEYRGLVKFLVRLR